MKRGFQKIAVNLTGTGLCCFLRLPPTVSEVGERTGSAAPRYLHEAGDKTRTVSHPIYTLTSSEQLSPMGTDPSFADKSSAQPEIQLCVIVPRGPSRC